MVCNRKQIKAHRSAIQHRQRIQLTRNFLVLLIRVSCFRSMLSDYPTSNSWHRNLKFYWIYRHIQEHLENYFLSTRTITTDWWSTVTSFTRWNLLNNLVWLRGLTRIKTWNWIRSMQNQLSFILHCLCWLPDRSLQTSSCVQGKPIYNRTFSRMNNLTLKAPNNNCSRWHFNFLLLSVQEIKAWFFMRILF